MKSKCANDDLSQQRGSNYAKPQVCPSRIVSTKGSTPVGVPSLCRAL